MPKVEYTDSQRLDWLTSKGCVEIEDEYMGPIRVQQSGDTLGKGKTLRDALDSAMRRAKVKPAPGVTAPPADDVHQAKRAGFMFGWKAAAKWANRDDLIADIGSPAYERDCTAACGVGGNGSQTVCVPHADALGGKEDERGA